MAVRTTSFKVTEPWVLASGGDDGSSDSSADSSQVYQVPTGYESYAAGTLISYGGASYVLQGNGTMVLSVQIGGGGGGAWEGRSGIGTRTM